MTMTLDSLAEALQGISAMGAAGGMGGALGYRDSPLAGMYSHEIGLAAYQSSGMMRRVIQLPATARVQKWRDWQATDEQIELIEAEERRLNLRAKVGEAEALRMLGGGALILVTEGDHSEPLDTERIKPGGLIAVNVVSRWQIRPVDFDRELTSPRYGLPRAYEVMTEGGGNQRIDPSRVIAFRGPPLPSGGSISDEQSFWGDSRLMQVFDAVMRSDSAQEWFAALIKKAKLLRIGIPGLGDLSETDEGRRVLASRIRLIAECENILNAVVYDKGDPNDEASASEEITDYAISFTGIPQMADMFDLRLCAVAAIPFTILMGRSPAGLSSTGEHDMASWRDTVSDGQENETRPCLEAFDDVLVRSAGVIDDGSIWWKFSPLDTPDQKESAETFKLTSEAIKIIRDAAVVPDVALNEAAQNVIMENGWLSGIESALDKLSDDERFGTMPDDDGTDPSALQAGQSGITNDAKPIPLYVRRDLLNAGDLIKWAYDNGLKTTLPASDMHVTVLYSKEPVDPITLGNSWIDQDGKAGLIIKRGGPRALERFGENALVLQFASSDLLYRHKEMVDLGASHDYPEYLPHVTITYDAPDDFDIASIIPYQGKLHFGPEIFQRINEDWKSGVKEE